MFGEVNTQQGSDLQQRALQPSLSTFGPQGRGDFLSKSYLYCTKQPGLGWPSSAFKQRWAEILLVSQRPHLAHAQAGEVEISVFPRVGLKSPAFDKAVKRVYKRDKEAAGSRGPCGHLSCLEAFRVEISKREQPVSGPGFPW